MPFEGHMGVDVVRVGMDSSRPHAHETSASPRNDAVLHSTEAYGHRCILQLGAKIRMM